MSQVVVDREDSKEPWHLDKRVPVSLIFALIVQTAMVAGAWFSHKQEFDNFQEHTRIEFARLQTNTDDRYRKSQALADLALRDERIARLAADLAGLKLSISDLDKSLDTKFEKLSDLIISHNQQEIRHREDRRTASKDP